MAEAVGDEWAEARALNTLGLAELSFDPEAGRTRLTPQHRARPGDRRRLGRRGRLEDDDRLVLHPARRSGRRACARRAATDRREPRQRVLPRLVLLRGRLLRGAPGRLRRPRAPSSTRACIGARSSATRRPEGSPRPGRSTLAPRPVTTQKPRPGWRHCWPARTPSGSGLALAEVVTALADIALATGDVATARRVPRAGDRRVGRRDSALVAGPAPPGARRGPADRAAISRARRRRSTKRPSSSSRSGNDWLLALDRIRARARRPRRGEANAEDLLHSALRRQVLHDLRPGITATLDALGALAFDAESTIEAVRCFAGCRRAPVGDRAGGATVRGGATHADHRVSARAPRCGHVRAALDRGDEPVARRVDRVRVSGSR